MKKLTLLGLLMIALAGCGSFTETQGINLAGPIKTVAIGEFSGRDSGVVGIFKQTVQKELLQAGFKIITVNQNPDISFDGAVNYKSMNLFTIGISDWLLIAKNPNGELIQSVGYKRGYFYWDAQPRDISEKLAKNLIKNLR